MDIDRDDFINSLGGADAAARMDHEARADAVEEYQSDRLEAAVPPTRRIGLTVEQVDAQIDTRAYRRGAGKLFIAEAGTVRRLPPMPERPTLVDFFERRFQSTQHVLQSASLAQRGRRERRSGARMPPARSGTVADADRSRLVERAAVRAVRVGARRVRDPVSPGAALLRRPGRRLRVSRAVLQAVRRRLRAAAARRGRVPDGAQSSVVHGRAAGHDERSVCIRSADGRDARSVYRSDRPPLQAAVRRAGQRQLAGRAHVAHAGDSGRATLNPVRARTGRTSVLPRAYLAASCGFAGPMERR